MELQLEGFMSLQIQCVVKIHKQVITDIGTEGKMNTGNVG